MSDHGIPRPAILRPLPLCLLAYLVLLHIAGIWIFLTLRFSPGDSVLAPLHLKTQLGLSWIEWIMLCNIGWMILFAFDWFLAKYVQALTARRTRRVIAICALLGLALFEVGAWKIYAVAT